MSSRRFPLSPAQLEAFKEPARTRESIVDDLVDAIAAADRFLADRGAGVDGVDLATVRELAQLRVDFLSEDPPDRGQLRELALVAEGRRQGFWIAAALLGTIAGGALLVHFAARVLG